MDIERRTPGNTAIVLIDYVTGFANLFRSQSVQENVSGAMALAKTARPVRTTIRAGPCTRRSPRSSATIP